MHVGGGGGGWGGIVEVIVVVGEVTSSKQRVYSTGRDLKWYITLEV